MAQILNNVIVWMVLYCAQQFLVWFFGFERKINWKKMKSNENQLTVNWNQLKVSWNQLKVNWFQLKSLLKLTILKIVEGGRNKLRVIQYIQIVWGGALTLISSKHYIYTVHNNNVCTSNQVYPSVILPNSTVTGTAATNQHC